MNNEMHTHISLPIPPGVKFGRRVLLVPAVSPVFSHSGLVAGLKKNARYTWVQRGNFIGKYSMAVPKTRVPFFSLLMGNTVVEATIPSPASGLLLHSLYEFGNDQAEFAQIGKPEFRTPVRMAILLPDGEPTPESSQRLFNDVAQLVWRHKAPFLKPSKLWSKGAMSEAALKKSLDEQLQLAVHTVDALPGFKDYVAEAVSLQPHLQPYLKHLL